MTRASRSAAKALLLTTAALALPIAAADSAQPQYAGVRNGASAYVTRTSYARCRSTSPAVRIPTAPAPCLVLCCATSASMAWPNSMPDRTMAATLGGNGIANEPPVPTRPVRSTTTAHAQHRIPEVLSTQPPSIPTARSAPVAASAASARLRAPRIVSSSPIGWSGTCDGTEMLVTCAWAVSGSSTARAAATFTGFVEPTAMVRMSESSMGSQVQFEKRRRLVDGVPKLTSRFPTPYTPIQS